MARCHVLLQELLGLAEQAYPLQKLCPIYHRFEDRHQQVCSLSIVHPLQKPGISDDLETWVVAKLASNVDIGNDGRGEVTYLSRWPCENSLCLHGIFPLGSLASQSPGARAGHRLRKFGHCQHWR